MTNKKALITGIAGQDGSYLAELLLAEGFEVFGTIRRNSTPENQVNAYLKFCLHAKMTLYRYDKNL